MESVVKDEQHNGLGSSLESSLLLTIAQVADEIPAWGSQPAHRDVMLRKFWPTESTLASAIYSTASRYTAFGWTLEGPQRTVGIVRRMLHNSDRGAGWDSLSLKTIIDLLTTDNGAFIEIVRVSDDPLSPVIELNHLDSAKCVRTGRHLEPVIYYDITGQGHKLKWYQIMTLTEFPSPQQEMRGMQICAVSRILRAAQIIKDIGIYESEKIGGKFNRAIHVIGGVSKKTIEEALSVQRMEMQNLATIRYLDPLIIGALDPTARVSKETIELASLPDHFDKETAMRWYINNMALAFGGDYQDFAPLPGGNLGSAMQSQVLHLKSRGKGPALFMRMMEQKFNFHGIMPDTVRFRYGEQDVAEDMEKAELRLKRAQERKLRIESGEITPAIARQMALDSGDIDEKYLSLIGEHNATPDVVVSSAT